MSPGTLFGFQSHSMLLLSLEQNLLRDRPSFAEPEELKEDKMFLILVTHGPSVERDSVMVLQE